LFFTLFFGTKLATLVLYLDEFQIACIVFKLFLQGLVLTNIGFDPSRANPALLYGSQYGFDGTKACRPNVQANW